MFDEIGSIFYFILFFNNSILYAKWISYTKINLQIMVLEIGFLEIPINYKDRYNILDIFWFY